MALITCQKACFAYEGLTVIQDLNLSIERGEYLCVIGENGSGKSTLMKTLLHLKKPLGGALEFGDGLTQSKIGYLPQQTVVQRDFPASVREIVRSGCLNQGGMNPFYTKAQKALAEEKMKKIREMVDVNSVIGEPITTPDGITIIPVSKVSVGFGGGGSDFVSKNVNHQENPFGGGVGAGVKVTPIAFLVIKEGNVRMLPVATPANTTADRIVEMVPDTLDKIAAFVDNRLEKK